MTSLNCSMASITLAESFVMKDSGHWSPNRDLASASSSDLTNGIPHFRPHNQAIRPIMAMMIIANTIIPAITIITPSIPQGRSPYQVFGTFRRKKRYVKTNLENSDASVKI